MISRKLFRQFNYTSSSLLRQPTEALIFVKNVSVLDERKNTPNTPRFLFSVNFRTIPPFISL